jgi:tetratricopeptide (TPR) repeat protein
MEAYLSALAAGDYSAATKFATALIQSNAPNANLLCHRAFCHLKLEFYRKCIKECDEALELDPKCGSAFLRKGQALLKMGKTAEAKLTFEKGVQEGLSEVEVMMALYRALREPESAEIVSDPKILSNPVSSVTGAGAASSSSQPAELDASLKNQDLDAKQAEALAQVAARGMVQNGVGDTAIDQRIAFGNLQVNTGKYAMGVKVFGELLKEYPKLVAAYLGRGTALALVGALEEACKDFGAALLLAPHNIDALKRRAQVLSALLREKEALADLDTAVNVSKDADSFHQRGISYYKLHNYKRAIADFTTAAKLEHSNKATYNYLGQCHLSMGQPSLALENYRKALALDPSYKEALANLGQAYKEWAKESEAFKHFSLAIAADAQYSHAFYLRGVAYFAIGLHKHAFNDFTKALQIDKNLFEAWWMRAVCASGIGLEINAISDFDSALSLRPDHAAWYQRQLALFYHHQMDTPLDSFNIDAALDPEFKEAWCKRNVPHARLPKQPPVTKQHPDVDLGASGSAWLATPDLILLIDFADQVGRWVHQDSPGFLKNRRQIAMAGFAAVEMAQTLRKIWGLSSPNSTPNASSSTKNKSQKPSASPKKGAAAGNSQGGATNLLNGKSSSKDRSPHPFNWRDMYDIAVKWRQYSEPNDPVWWVDLLTPSQFAEGFGSHTPIITGQCKVIRYGRMYERALPLFKSLMKQQCVLDSQQLSRLETAESPDDLYKLMNRDFFVVTPCHSTATPGKVMEGTRVTIQNAPPEGYEFSIRTPGTPPRWVDYDIELTHLFDQLTSQVKELHKLQTSAQQSDASKLASTQDAVAETILTIAFYWYNFMPLARGTAICGYVSILGMFLAAGFHLQAPIPTNVLLDWDAILLPTPKEFIHTCKDWLLPHRTPLDVSQFDSLPLVQTAIPSLRHLFSILNAVCKD